MRKADEMNSKQTELMQKLKLPASFDGLTDDELMRIEDKLSNEMQLHGINGAGNGLNDYGKLCLSIIEIIPDN